MNRSKLLSTVLALLRAMQHHYQTSHWQVQGSDFYEQHLLFERLYDNLGEEIDVLAEKIVGLDGVGHVNSVDQVTKMKTFLSFWEDFSGDYIEKSLLAERVLQNLLEQVYHNIDTSGNMTLGLDDYIMALANAHETHLYLLQQVKG